MKEGYTIKGQEKPHFITCKVVDCRIRRYSGCECNEGDIIIMRSETLAQSQETLRSEGRKYVNHVMKDTAALHNSDQVSGGKTQIEYEKGSIKNRTDLQNSDIIGGSRANWYIGTQQWPRKEDHEARATELKQHVVKQYNNTPESDKNKLMMSVTLKVV